MVRRYVDNRRCINLTCSYVTSLSANIKVNTPYIAGDTILLCLINWKFMRPVGRIRRFAGVAICCVERWKFIRRIAGTPIRRSYQSVVLNVGSLYACSPLCAAFAGLPIACVERMEVYTPVRSVLRFAGVRSLLC